MFAGQRDSRDRPLIVGVFVSSMLNLMALIAINEREFPIGLSSTGG